MIPIHITSLTNPKIKTVVKLEKSGHRKDLGLFKVEGLREIEYCHQANYVIEELYYCPDVFDHGEQLAANNFFNAKQLIEISKAVFEKIAYREGSDGLIAVVKAQYNTLNELKLSDNPLIIVLEKVEKPGNLGAILRTADAAKADAVIVCDTQTDIFNPNTIRSSVGCLFTTQVVTCSNDECVDFLQSKQIHIFSAALTAKNFYHEQNLNQASAFVFGTEANGLSPFWLNEQHATQIKIPMRGAIDSLNVANSCAIILFEACRQRGFKD